MTSPISPPQRRNTGAKTADDRTISDTLTQPSVSHGSRSDPLLRVPQYDQGTDPGWPPGRSPPTCPRSMRSADTSSACKVSGLLGTSVEVSGSNPDEGIAHASIRFNGNQVDMNSKAMESDGATSSGSALLGTSSTISGSKIKRCHSCRKPQIADEHPPWVRCSGCKHRNHPLCCESEVPEKEVAQ